MKRIKISAVIESWLVVTDEELKDLSKIDTTSILQTAIDEAQQPIEVRNVAFMDEPITTLGEEDIWQLRMESLLFDVPSPMTDLAFNEISNFKDKDEG